MSCIPRAGGGLGYAVHEASGTYIRVNQVQVWRCRDKWMGGLICSAIVIDVEIRNTRHECETADDVKRNR